MLCQYVNNFNLKFKTKYCINVFYYMHVHAHTHGQKPKTNEAQNIGGKSNT